MREIQLTKGFTAIVDDEDYERVAAFKWHVVTPGRFGVYGARWRKKAEGPRGYIFLHRFILDVTDGKIKVDHKDGNGLNCSRSNLRTCTQSQNNINRRKSPDRATSQYKGVSKYWYRWVARINSTYLGLFETEEDAARAYDRAARELFGEFAHCNFPS